MVCPAGRRRRQILPQRLAHAFPPFLARHTFVSAQRLHRDEHQVEIELGVVELGHAVRPREDPARENRRGERQSPREPGRREQARTHPSDAGPFVPLGRYVRTGAGLRALGGFCRRRGRAASSSEESPGRRDVFSRGRPRPAPSSAAASAGAATGSTFAGATFAGSGFVRLVSSDPEVGSWSGPAADFSGGVPGWW